ncbi:MAG: DUF488 domain-containing protein [Kiritimatiellae bacterium]|nr:DUF488 domain-containing protein [Kiritimatiellia bacterium]
MNDEEFIRRLQQHKVDAVIDIRLRNEGRFYKFASGRHINTLVEAHEITYVHETRFAPTEEMLKAFQQTQDWPAYELAYKHLILTRELARLWREVAKQFQRPCLLCAEKSPEYCHRRLLAEYLSEAASASITHIRD